MIFDLLILFSLVLTILHSLRILSFVSIWVLLIPAFLAYGLRLLFIVYDRFSASRWDEYQRIRALEADGMREFKDVMIGTVLAYIRRTPISAEILEPPDEPVEEEPSL